MLTVTNKFTTKDIAELIDNKYKNVYYATKIKGTTYAKYFKETPSPTFVEKNKTYYDSEAVEKFRQFFIMDKMQEKIFTRFIEQYQNKNIKYI